MASENPLHDFDKALCAYVATMVAPVVPRMEIPESDGKTYSLLLKWLQKHSTPSHFGLLLNDAEFDRLQVWCSSLPSDERNLWGADGGYRRRRSIEPLAEIHEELGREVGSQWVSDSVRLADRLERDDLRLADGVETVWEWASEARRLLLAMGKTDFLPRPEGDYPTPSNAGTQVASSRRMSRLLRRLMRARSKGMFGSELDEVLDRCQKKSDIEQVANHEHFVPSVECVRWAIRHGGDDSGHALYQRVLDHNRTYPEDRLNGANKQMFYAALKILNRLGEHGDYKSKSSRE